MKKKLLMNSSKKSEHVLDTMHQNWFCPWGPFFCKVPSFISNPWEGTEHGQNTLNQKTTHFEKATFWDLQLWFVHFSSHVKCCRHVCVQHFTSELKCPNQRQGAFLGHLKWKDVDLKNLLFKVMLFSLIWCILSIEMDCICRKELLGGK